MTMGEQETDFWKVKVKETMTLPTMTVTVTVTMLTWWAVARWAETREPLY